MKSAFYHLQCNIDYTNIDFYKNLFSALGWEVIFDETEALIGFTSGANGDLWFAQSEKNTQQDYDGFGVNHISIRVEKQIDVGTIVTLLTEHNTASLFETPRHRAEFAAGPNETYYQVMFESPDKILFEIVYTGSKESV